MLAMYHPAAALRTPAIERESYDDIGHAPQALIDARTRRNATAASAPTTAPAERSTDIDTATLVAMAADPGAPAPDELTIF